MKRKLSKTIEGNRIPIDYCSFGGYELESTFLDDSNSYPPMKILH